MASRNLDGNDYIVFIDTVTDPSQTVNTSTNYRPVICMQTNGIGGTTDTIDVSDKCGNGYADPIPGGSSWEITGTGNAVDEAMNPSKASYQELFTLWKNKEAFWMKIANKPDGNGTPIIREGVGMITSFTETADTDNPYTFDFTFTGKEDLYNVDVWYGYEYSILTAAPEVIRIGSEALHRSLPIQSGMRRCLLADNGTVNYYLNAEDSTIKEDNSPAVLDGSDGQVMVEIPEHYKRIEASGDIRRYRFSQYAIPGYDLVPKMYVSAYEASLNRTGNILSSVVNDTAQYRGGNNSSAWDAQPRTLLGKPVSNVNLDNFRLYAANRGANWYCENIIAYMTWCHLFICEYGTRNSQANFNPSLTPSGLRQGGLGEGVTNWVNTDWSTYNNRNPFINCGVTNGIGNNTGIVSVTTNGLASNVPSYRGIENPFGHIWKWCDGVLLQTQSVADGGQSLLFVCKDKTKFASTVTADYEFVGNTSRVSGYIREVILGLFAPVDNAGGSSSTYYCDNYYAPTIPGSGVELTGLRVGSLATDGAAAGLACTDATYAPSISSAAFGSRLCFIG